MPATPAWPPRHFAWPLGVMALIDAGLAIVLLWDVIGVSIELPLFSAVLLFSAGYLYSLSRTSRPASMKWPAGLRMGAAAGALNMLPFLISPPQVAIAFMLALASIAALAGAALLLRGRRRRNGEQ